MTDLRHEINGDRVDVYLCERHVAYMEPRGQGYAVFNPIGGYLMDAGSIATNLDVLRGQMDVGTFPRRRTIPAGDLKIGNVCLSDPPGYRQRVVAKVAGGPGANCVITYEDGIEEWMSTTQDVTVAM